MKEKWFLTSTIIWAGAITIATNVVQALGADAPTWLVTAINVASATLIIYRRSTAENTTVTLMPPETPLTVVKP